MISDEQLEQLAEYLLKALESKAYAEPEKELSDTQIVDKNGVVHDLKELENTSCVIDTGVSVHMFVQDFYSYKDRWISSHGYENTSERLAALIRKHYSDPDCVITVHKF
mgnify:CR=1 FL=1